MAAAVRRPVSRLITLGAVLVGLLAFSAFEFAAAALAKAVWPAYAAAAPRHAYTFAMLLVRLGAGAAITLAASGLATRIGRSGDDASWVFGVALLVLSIILHSRMWDQYPAWYHLGWFACIVPSAVLGGRLAMRSAKIALDAQ